MTWHEFEIVLIGFTLGALARPAAALLLERHDASERERLAQQRADVLRHLGDHLAAKPHRPHPARTTADWLNDRHAS